MSSVRQTISIAKTPWAEFTLPSASVNYLAGAVVSSDDASPGNVMKFIAVPEQGGSGVVKRVMLHSGERQDKPLKPVLYLLNRLPAQAFGANDTPFRLSDMDLKWTVGTVDLNYPTRGFHTSGYLWEAEVSIPFETMPDSRKLYGILVAAEPYDSAASETFRVTLGIV